MNYTFALFKKAVFNLRHKKFISALKNLKKAGSINRNDALVYYNLGLTYEGLKQYGVALKSYARALKLDPLLLDAKVCQGFIYGKIYGNLKKELACYRNVLSRNPAHLIARYNQAVVWDELGETNKAIKIYLELLKAPLLVSKQKDVCMRLTHSLINRGDFPGARQILLRLINLKKRSGGR